MESESRNRELIQKMNLKTLIAIVCLVGPNFLAEAGEFSDLVESKEEKKNKKSSGDFLKALEKNKWPQVYRDKKGFVERVRLIGRMDYQGSHTAWNGGDDTYFGLRRFRLGFEAEIADDWKLKVMGGFLNGSDVGYAKLDAAILRYRVNKRLKIRIGKQVPHFGHEWSTPSMQLRVIERSLLTEQVRPRRATGFVVERDGKDFDWDIGVFSGDRDDELGNLDSGFFSVVGLHYDLEDTFDTWDNFDWHFYYMYQDSDAGNRQTKGYGHSYSTAIDIREDDFRFRLEGIYADGHQGRPDAYGFIATASQELIEDKLDLVLRYHYAKGDGRDGLRTPAPFGGLLPEVTDRGRGEEYQSIYLGLNYYLIEERLHWMNGVQWSEMKDTFGDGGGYDGFSFLTSLRYAF